MSNKNASLWELTYDVGENTTWLSSGVPLNELNYAKGEDFNEWLQSNSPKCKLITNLDIEQKGEMEIVNTDTGYDIVYNGATIYNLPVTQDSKNANSIGFISDHWTHGCYSNGYFAITNIKAKIKFNT